MAVLPQDPKYPKFPGPPFEAVRALPINESTASTAAAYPFNNSKSQMFPPVCLRSHWDPEQIIRRTLPSQQVSTPLEPRPWTKVCMEYVTSQEFEEAPRPPDSLVYPSGGSVYPPTRYSDSIQNESRLRRLDRPLGTCERDQYVPPFTGNLFRRNLITQKEKPSAFVTELAFPMACMRTAPYDCRANAEEADWNRSTLPFNNATKQDRYYSVRGNKEHDARVLPHTK